MRLYGPFHGGKATAEGTPTSRGSLPPTTHLPSHLLQLPWEEANSSPAIAPPSPQPPVVPPLCNSMAAAGTNGKFLLTQKLKIDIGKEGMQWDSRPLEPNSLGN